METHLKINHLAPYLPYRLRFDNGRDYEKDYLLGIRANGYNVPMAQGSRDYDYFRFEKIKPILRPLSDLTKDINYGLSTYAFTDLFEIGDCGGCVFEFEHGNIKTIKTLENISKYNLYEDINYLPNAVVNMMYEYHFDVFGLIEKGLAIDKNTLK